jgi:hypothetical protein
MNKKVNRTLNRIIYFGPIVTLVSLYLVSSEFVEENWLIPVSLMMIVGIAFLKFSGGYKGISTLIATVAICVTLVLSWWLYPKNSISGGIYCLSWIVMIVVVWWDRSRLT